MTFDRIPQGIEGVGLERKWLEAQDATAGDSHCHTLLQPFIRTGPVSKLD
jgi:hypothetical protein